ncbi:MAG: hypothetical protein J0M37_05895 [Ignavibacteria bacterium]|nr:hypothetical protein [Ignavibacteria bacterium]
MAKPFNQLLHDDIKMLKDIDRGAYPEEFKLAFRNIMKRHSISRTTVYAELEKAIPGVYKTHDSKSRHILIDRKEVELVKDLLSEGRSIRYISRTMSLELGFRYTPYRIYKVKELIYSGKSETEIYPVVQAAAGIESAKLLEERVSPVPPKPKEPVEFKGNISLLFYRLSMLNFIDPERKLKIKIAGNTIETSGRVVKDCLSHIICSAGGGGQNIPEVCRFEMETILIKELDAAKRGIKLTPSALKQLESIRISLLSSSESSRKPQIKGGYDLDDVVNAVRHFAPDTKKDEVKNYFAKEKT